MPDSHAAHIWHPSGVLNYYNHNPVVSVAGATSTTG